VSDYPAWVTDEAAAAASDVEVDWASLPEGWRDRNPKNRGAGETRPDHANRVRAQVAEGLADPSLLPYADRL